MKAPLYNEILDICQNIANASSNDEQTLMLSLFLQTMMTLPEVLPVVTYKNCVQQIKTLLKTTRYNGKPLPILPKMVIKQWIFTK